MKHLRITVTGLVQGVFFRANTLEKAKSLELKGFVRNEADGSVLIEVEGDDDNLQALVDWAHSGSEGAQVSDVQVKEGDLQGFTEFIIDRT